MQARETDPTLVSLGNGVTSESLLLFTVNSVGIREPLGSLGADGLPSKL